MDAPADELPRALALGAVEAPVAVAVSPLLQPLQALHHLRPERTTATADGCRIALRSALHLARSARLRCARSLLRTRASLRTRALLRSRALLRTRASLRARRATLALAALFALPARTSQLGEAQSQAQDLAAQLRPLVTRSANGAALLQHIRATLGPPLGARRTLRKGRRGQERKRQDRGETLHDHRSRFEVSAPGASARAAGRGTERAWRRSERPTDITQP